MNIYRQYKSLHGNRKSGSGCEKQSQSIAAPPLSNIACPSLPLLCSNTGSGSNCLVVVVVGLFDLDIVQELQPIHSVTIAFGAHDCVVCI